MRQEEDGIWVTYKTKRAWVSSMHLVQGKEAILRRLYEQEELKRQQEQLREP